jgi:hypothetical protein
MIFVNRNQSSRPDAGVVIRGDSHRMAGYSLDKCEALLRVDN